MAAKNMSAIKTQRSIVSVYISTYKRVCVVFIKSVLLRAKKTIPACVCWGVQIVYPTLSYCTQKTREFNHLQHDK